MAELTITHSPKGDIRTGTGPAMDLYDELVTKYGGRPTPGATPADWTLDAKSRYVLVERNVAYGGFWLSGHRDPEGAAYYHDNQDYAEDFAVVEVVDLETGDRVEVETIDRAGLCTCGGPIILYPHGGGLGRWDHVGAADDGHDPTPTPGSVDLADRWDCDDAKAGTLRTFGEVRRG